MTGTEHSSDTRDCGGDVAAYVLGALEPGEVEAFRAHLETCVVCRDELVAFQHVVDVLPMSAAQHPAPRRLRRRVMRAVNSEPKHEPAPGLLPRLAALIGPRPGLALGTGLAVLLLVVGGVLVGSSSSPRTRVFAAQVTGSGTATVKVTGGEAELIVRHFAPPPAGEIYEVWLGRPNRAPAPTSALFSVTAKGDGDVDIPGNLHGVSLVMVTPEPAGGSPVPTHPPVIRAQLT
jgi:anti-sigma factor RsiW